MDKFPPYNPYPDRRECAFSDAVTKIQELLASGVSEKAKFTWVWWWLTEVEGKYNLRYWSAGGIEHYQGCSPCQSKIKKYEGRERKLGKRLDKKKVQHEHVYTMRSLTQRLFDGEPVESVVKNAVACVVSEDDKAKLRKRHERGWERYCIAQIDVLKYDSDTGQWVDFIKDGKCVNNDE